MNSNSQTNLTSGFNSHLTKRIITSSIDKDLHREFKLNNNKLNNNLSHLKENDVDMKTSSPLKNKKFNLNTTIDLNTRNLNSNESLNESEQSLSVSQSSSIANFHLQNDDDPRTVFNSTYTAWATTDQQVQIDAYNQHRKIVESTSSIGLNRTQDMNNNTSRDDLNKTKDIIHDSNENLNRTRDLKQPSKVLNTTQDLAEPSTNFKPIPANQLRRISSLQSTRPSSIYQKSKLLPQASLNPKPVTSLPQTKTELKKVPTNTKLVQPLTTQSVDLTKPKLTGIPKAPLAKSVTSPVKSPVNPTQLQRPNTLATQNGNSLKQNPLTSSNSSQPVNLNRLSSTSSSSSTSTSSSSSLKENLKKSPTSQIKSPTGKIGTLSSLNQNNGLSRLKPPCVTASTVNKPLTAPQPSVYTNKVVPEAPKSMLKPPTQIPTFKIPTGIPTLRNATNKK